MSFGRARHSLCVVLASLTFLSQVVFPHRLEASFWEQRAAARRASSSLADSAPLTTLPSFLPRPSTSFSLLKAVPLNRSRIADVFVAKGSNEPPVVLIQDVHLNAEAQRNIADALQSLIDAHEVSTVGVEGAFGAFDFSKFHGYSNKAATKKALMQLVDQNLLAAPSFVGITNLNAAPSFVGIDDRPHYNANVQAYLTSRQSVRRVEQELDKLQSMLDGEKQKEFSPLLAQFDRAQNAYASSHLSLASYLRWLEKVGARLDDLNVQQFLEADRLEKSLDFSRVEAERRIVLGELAKRLTPSGSSALVAWASLLNMGQVSAADFHAHLKDLCAQHGVSLSAFSSFDNYLRYVLLADSIKAEKLLASVGAIEKDFIARTANAEQKKLLNKSRELQLARKLVRFELTSEEWKEFARGRVGEGARGRNKPLSTQTVENNLSLLSDFERFYDEANARSEKMLANLSAFSPTRPLAPSPAQVLICGGFHTSQLKELLKKQNRSYVVLSPVLSKVSDESGSSYLSAFAREKTPLDRLVSGEKLFLAPEDINVGPGGPLSTVVRTRLTPVLADSSNHDPDIKETGDTKSLNVDEITVEAGENLSGAEQTWTVNGRTVGYRQVSKLRAFTPVTSVLRQLWYRLHLDAIELALVFLFTTGAVATELNPQQVEMARKIVGTYNALFDLHNDPEPAIDATEFASFGYWSVFTKEKILTSVALLFVLASVVRDVKKRRRPSALKLATYALMIGLVGSSWPILSARPSPDLLGEVSDGKIRLLTSYRHTFEYYDKRSNDPQEQELLDRMQSIYHDLLDSFGVLWAHEYSHFAGFPNHRLFAEAYTVVVMAKVSSSSLDDVQKDARELATLATAVLPDSKVREATVRKLIFSPTLLSQYAVPLREEKIKILRSIASQLTPADYVIPLLQIEGGGSALPHSQNPTWSRAPAYIYGETIGHIALLTHPTVEEAARYIKQLAESATPQQKRIGLLLFLFTTAMTPKDPVSFCGPAALGVIGIAFVLFYSVGDTFTSSPFHHVQMMLRHTLEEVSAIHQGKGVSKDDGITMESSYYDPATKVIQGIKELGKKGPLGKFDSQLTGARVLLLGSGAHPGVEKLLEAFPGIAEIHVVDVSDTGFQAVDEEAGRAKANGHVGTAFFGYQTTVLAMPQTLKTRPVDLVIDVSLFDQHFFPGESRELAEKEVDSVLVPGGIHFTGGIDPLHHRRGYTLVSKPRERLFCYRKDLPRSLVTLGPKSHRTVDQFLPLIAAGMLLFTTGMMPKDPVSFSGSAALGVMAIAFVLLYSVGDFFSNHVESELKKDVQLHLQKFDRLSDGKERRFIPRWGGFEEQWKALVAVVQKFYASQTEPHTLQKVTDRVMNVDALTHLYFDLNESEERVKTILSRRAQDDVEIRALEKDSALLPLAENILAHPARRAFYHLYFVEQMVTELSLLYKGTNGEVPSREYRDRLREKIEQWQPDVADLSQRLADFDDAHAPSQLKAQVEKIRETYSRLTGSQLPRSIVGAGMSVFFDWETQNPIRDIKSHSVLSYLDYAFFKGLGGIEITYDYVPFDASKRFGLEYTASDLETERLLADAFGLHNTAHGPFIGHQIDANTFQSAPDSPQFFIEQALVARRSGKHSMVIHLADLEASSVDAMAQFMVNAYHALSTDAKNKDPHFLLAFENYERKDRRNDFPTSDEFVSQWERIGERLAERARAGDENAANALRYCFSMLFDSAHLNLSNREDPLQAARTVALRLRHFASSHAEWGVRGENLLAELHLNQNVGLIGFYPGRSADVHTRVSVEGPIDNELIIMTVRALGFRPFVLMEQMDEPNEADLALMSRAFNRGNAVDRWYVRLLAPFPKLFFTYLFIKRAGGVLSGFRDLRTHQARRRVQDLVDFAITPQNVDLKSLPAGVRLVRPQDIARHEDYFQPIQVNGSYANRFPAHYLIHKDTLVSEERNPFGQFFILCSAKPDEPAGVVNIAGESRPLRNGTFVGEAALSGNGARRSADVMIYEGTSLLAFDSRVFQSYQQLVPALKLLVDSNVRARRAEDREIVRKLIRENLILLAVDPAAVESLASTSEEVRLDGGSTLFEEGDVADALYIVLSGRLEIVGATANGEKKKVATLSSGNVVGEAAYFASDRRRNAAVRVASDKAVVVRIPYAALDHVMERKPELKRLWRLPLEHRNLLRKRALQTPDAMAYAPVKPDISNWTRDLLRYIAEIVCRQNKWDLNDFLVVCYGSLGRDEEMFVSDVDQYVFPKGSTDPETRERNIRNAQKLDNEIRNTLTRVLQSFGVYGLVADPGIKDQYARFFYVPVDELAGQEFLWKPFTDMWLPEFSQPLRDLPAIISRTFRDLQLVSGDEQDFQKLEAVIAERIYSPKRKSDYEKALIGALRQNAYELKNGRSKMEPALFEIKDMGLRTLQFFGWLMRSRYADDEEIRSCKNMTGLIQLLHQRGRLSDQEADAMMGAYALLLHLRQELYLIGIELDKNVDLRQLTPLTFEAIADRWPALSSESPEVRRQALDRLIRQRIAGLYESVATVLSRQPHFIEQSENRELVDTMHAAARMMQEHLSPQRSFSPSNRAVGKILPIVAAGLLLFTTGMTPRESLTHPAMAMIFVAITVAAILGMAASDENLLDQNITDDRFPVTIDGLSAAFEGEGFPKLQQFNSLLGDAKEGDGVKTVKFGSSSVLFIRMYVNGQRKWTFAGKDREAIAGHMGWRVRFKKIEDVGPKDIVVSKDGLTAVFPRQEVRTFAPRLNAELGEPTSENPTKTLGEGDQRVHFFVKRRVRFVWTCDEGEAENLKRYVGWDIEEFDPKTEFRLSAIALVPIFGHAMAKTVFEFVEKELGPVRSGAGAVVPKGSGVSFRVRRAKTRTMWAFKREDLHKFKIWVGENLEGSLRRQGIGRSSVDLLSALSAVKKIEPVQPNDITVVRPSFENLFAGKAQRLVKELKNLLGEPSIEKTAFTLVRNGETVHFYLREVKEERRHALVWAFDKSELTTLAKAMGWTLRSFSVPAVENGLVPLSSTRLPEYFIGNAYRMSIEINEMLTDPEKATQPTATLGSGRDKVTCYLRKSGSNSVWAVRETDMTVIARFMGWKLRGEDGSRLDELDLSEAVALLGSDPLRLHQYIRLYHPELSPEDVAAVTHTAISGLGGGRPSSEALHVGFTTTGEAPSLLTPPQKSFATSQPSFVISGKVAAGTDYIQSVGAYTRRIRVREDGGFTASLPLPRVGQENVFHFYGVRENLQERTPSVIVTVLQTSQKESVEDAFIRLIALKKEVLDSIQRDPARYHFLLRSLELSLLRHFTYGETQGFAVLKEKIKKEKSPTQRRILETILKKFETIASTPYPLAKGQRLYFFQKYTIAEVKATFERGSRGYMIANEQGLGKTLTALMIIGSSPAMVMTPNAVVSTWVEEAERFLRGSRLMPLEGPYDQRERKLKNLGEKQWVTNIEFLRGMNDIRAVLIATLHDFLVLDEADFLGSARSQQARGAREIETAFRLLLTATPFKRLSQIASVLGSLYPEDSRFTSLTAFARAYPSDDIQALNALFFLMQQNMIRIRKTDVFETYDPARPLSEQSDRLPKKVEMPAEMGQFKLSMEQCDSILELFTDYESWCRKHKGRETEEDKGYHRFVEGYFSKREALRQIMDDPAYIGRPDIDSPKHRKMDDIVMKELGPPEKLGEKMVIFCRYKWQVKEYLERYKEYGARAYYGDLPQDSNGYRIDENGRVLYYRTDEHGVFVLDRTGKPIETDKNSGEPIRAFDYERLLIQNDPHSRILVATYDTGSVGVTLTGAGVVVDDDLATTYRDQYQSDDRIHRIDNFRKRYQVRYYRLQAVYPNAFLKKLPAKTREMYFDMGTYDQVHMQNLIRQSRIFHRIMDGIGDEQELVAIHQRFMKDRMPFLFSSADAREDNQEQDELDVDDNGAEMQKAPADTRVDKLGDASAGGKILPLIAAGLLLLFTTGMTPRQPLSSLSVQVFLGVVAIALTTMAVDPFRKKLFLVGDLPNVFSSYTKLSDAQIANWREEKVPPATSEKKLWSFYKKQFLTNKTPIFLSFLDVFDEPRIEALFQHYLREQGLSRFPRVCAAFSHDVRVALLDDPALKPVFLVGLDDKDFTAEAEQIDAGASSNIDRLIADANRHDLWAFQPLDETISQRGRRLTVVENAAIAEKWSEAAVIHVRLSDQYYPRQRQYFRTAHARTAFVPTHEKSMWGWRTRWIGFKGVGDFSEEDPARERELHGAHFYTGMALYRPEWIELVKKISDEKEWSDLFIRSAWARRPTRVPTSNAKNWKDVTDQSNAIYVSGPVDSIHRLTKLRQLMKTDPGLVRLRRSLVAHFLETKQIKSVDELTARRLVEILIGMAGEQAAFLQKNDLAVFERHEQDFGMDGRVTSDELITIWHQERQLRWAPSINGLNATNLSWYLESWVAFDHSDLETLGDLLPSPLERTQRLFRSFVHHIESQRLELWLSQQWKTKAPSVLQNWNVPIGGVNPKHQTYLSVFLSAVQEELDSRRVKNEEFLALNTQRSAALETERIKALIALHEMRGQLMLQRVFMQLARDSANGRPSRAELAAALERIKPQFINNTWHIKRLWGDRTFAGKVSDIDISSRRNFVIGRLFQSPSCGMCYTIADVVERALDASRLIQQWKYEYDIDKQARIFHAFSTVITRTEKGFERTAIDLTASATSDDVQNDFFVGDPAQHRRELNAQLPTAVELQKRADRLFPQFDAMVANLKFENVIDHPYEDDVLNAKDFIGAHDLEYFKRLTLDRLDDAAQKVDSEIKNLERHSPRSPPTHFESRTSVGAALASIKRGPILSLILSSGIATPLFAQQPSGNLPVAVARPATVSTNNAEIAEKIWKQMTDATKQYQAAVIQRINLGVPFSNRQLLATFIWPVLNTVTRVHRTEIPPVDQYLSTLAPGRRPNDILTFRALAEWLRDSGKFLSYDTEAAVLQGVALPDVTMILMADIVELPASIKKDIQSLDEKISFWGLTNWISRSLVFETKSGSVEGIHVETKSKTNLVYLDVQNVKERAASMWDVANELRDVKDVESELKSEPDFDRFIRLLQLAFLRREFGDRLKLSRQQFIDECFGEFVLSNAGHEAGHEEMNRMKRFGHLEAGHLAALGEAYGLAAGILKVKQPELGLITVLLWQFTQLGLHKEGANLLFESVLSVAKQNPRFAETAAWAWPLDEATFKKLCILLEQLPNAELKELFDAALKDLLAKEDKRKAGASSMPIAPTTRASDDSSPKRDVDVIDLVALIDAVHTPRALGVDSWTGRQTLRAWAEDPGLIPEIPLPTENRSQFERKLAGALGTLVADISQAKERQITLALLGDRAIDDVRLVSAVAKATRGGRLVKIVAAESKVSHIRTLTRHFPTVIVEEASSALIKAKSNGKLSKSLLNETLRVETENAYLVYDGFLLDFDAAHDAMAFDEFLPPIETLLKIDDIKKIIAAVLSAA